jgi:small subunit ribosomal protein S1
MDPQSHASPESNHAGSNGQAPAHAPSPAPAPTSIDAQTQAEIDEAMAAIGLGPTPSGGGGGGGGGGKKKGPQASVDHSVTPIGGAQKPRVHGPRVVQAGREHRKGTVVSVGPTDVFLEFGPKSLGVAPRSGWPEDALPKVGEEVEVVVEKFEPSEQIYVCSRPGAVVKAAWENLEIGQTVEARVVGVNKGGLELEVSGHRAFMPASQVSLERIPDLSVLIGEKFTCQVSQLDKRGRGNIVLSRRDLLEVERREKAGKLKDTLAEGQTLDGVVRKIMPFGAFVDIGGVDGLVHITDLTYDRIGFGEQAIGKVLKEGQAVRVRVLKIEWNDQDMRKSRISLGMKQLAADPFTTAVADIKEGATVGGRVTRLADFGAFVELSPGVEGLVHVSEIAHRRVNHPQEMLKQDQVVQAKVLKIDPDSRRISLSLKALIDAPAAPARKGDKDRPTRTPEEIQKETPALRRLREHAKAKQDTGLKGGFGKGYDDGGGLAGLKL